MIKSFLAIKKITNKSRKNFGLLNKIIISLKFNLKKLNPIKRNLLFKSKNSTINLINKPHLLSKNRNSSPHSESNKTNLNSLLKHFMTRFPRFSFNSKPNNNNSNFQSKRMPFCNKKSKRTKKIMKHLETNLLFLSNMKTTTLSFNIFPKESQSMNRK